MKLFFLILLSSIPVLIFSQNVKSKGVEKRTLLFSSEHFYTIKPNIFRLTFSTPLSNDDNAKYAGVFGGNYERKMYKNISVVSKLGVGISVHDFGPSNNPYQTSYHTTGGLELRYHYALTHRIKKYRPTINYSGGYFSLEQDFISDPFYLSNQTYNGALQGSAGIFLNIGYQKQVKHLYINGFFAVLLKDDSPNPTIKYTRSALNARLGIGYVF